MLAVTQVDFYVEPMKDCLAGDACLPGWAAKVVSRADQAWFETREVKEKVVVFMHGYSMEMMHIRKGEEKEVEELVAEKPHFVTDVTIQCLAPVSDIEERLAKDLKESKKALEKNIRTSITNALKAKTKTIKSKKKGSQKDKDDADGVSSAKDVQGLSGKDAEKMFESLGMDLPATKQEQVTALQNLLAEEEKFEKLIKSATDAVPPLSVVPLTKLSDDGGRSSNRSKLMRFALSAAMGSATTGDGVAAAADAEASAKYGLQIALKEVDFVAAKKDTVFYWGLGLVSGVDSLFRLRLCYVDLSLSQAVAHCLCCHSCPLFVSLWLWVVIISAAFAAWAPWAHWPWNGMVHSRH